MSQDELSDLFPEMTPISSAPTLFTINGCGLILYGKRDFHRPTGTYVATRCAALIFVPLMCLNSYRVADAQGGGWYFVGKEPLSMFARMWNVLVAGLLFVGVGSAWWVSHTQSPEYQARQKLERGDALVADGKDAEGLALYREVADGPTGTATQGTAKLRKWLDEKAASAPLPAVTEALGAAVELRGRDRWPEDEATLAARGVALAAREGEPKERLAVLDAVAPLAGDGHELHAARRKVLEEAATKHADDLEIVSAFAAVLDEEGATERCKGLLEPFRDRLGTSEGARILGGVLSREGKFDEAYPLLSAYTEQRLGRLHEAEQHYEATFQGAQQRLLDGLRRGGGGDDFKRRFEAADDATRQGLVDEYLISKLRDDVEISRAQRQMMQAAKIVPVALELGVVLLNRAQDLPDPAARRAELEKAEKTFLAVKGVAGESDQYRLYLGQVYYWLGRQDEGRTLLNEVLTEHAGRPEVQLKLVHVFRDVGAESEARALAEKIHAEAKDDRTRHQAAQIRSLLHVDEDDQLAWLEKSDPQDPHVRASLHEGRARKAQRAGDDAAALRELGEAIAIWGKQPDSASKWNNAALCRLARFAVSHDAADLREAERQLDRAIALAPSDSILLHNVAVTIRGVAFRDLVGREIDLDAAGLSGDYDLLDHLADDAAGQQRLRERIAVHEGLRKAVEHFRKVQVLAPKRAGTYRELNEHYQAVRDAAAAADVLRRFDEAQPDLSEIRRQSLEFLEGTGDAKLRSLFGDAIARMKDRLQKVRQGGSKRTVAALADELAGRLATAGLLEPDFDPRESVELAEEAFAASPSVASRRALVTFLLARALHRLSKSQPDFAARLAPCWRALGPMERFALAAGRPGPWREALLADPDVQRAVAETVRLAADFPARSDPSAWMLLQTAGRAEAETVAAAVRKDEARRTSRTLERRLTPAGFSSSAYWEARILGDEGAARKIVDDARTAGSPVPADFP